MLYVIYLLLNFLLIDNVHAGNEETEIVDTPKNANVISSLIDSRTPDDELQYVTEMLQLPKSISPVIFGNFDRVPTDIKSNIIKFYKHCTSTESNKQSIRKLEWKLISAIFEWKSSEKKEPTKLDEELRNSMQQCLDDFRSHTVERSELGSKATETSVVPTTAGIDSTGTSATETNKTEIKTFLSQPMVDIDIRCPKESRKSFLLSELGNKETLVTSSSVIRGLPKAACGRATLINIALQFIRRSALSLYGKFVLSIEKQTINVIREYLIQEENEGKDELLKSLRIIFLHFTNWYEKFYRERGFEDPLVKKEYMYSPKPDNPNLPPVETILQSIPAEDRVRFSGNWKILMLILNFPVSIDPFIIGNIHLLPVSVIKKFLDSIEYCRRNSIPKIYYMEKVQNKMIAVLSRWKTILNNLSKPSPASQQFDANYLCGAKCISDSGMTKPDYIKIGDRVNCPNESRFTKELDKLKNLITGEMNSGTTAENQLFSADQYSRGEKLRKVILLLPAETCAWVYVVGLIVTKIPDVDRGQEMDSRLMRLLLQFSNNEKEDKTLFVELMNFFNELTFLFEAQHYEAIKSREKELIGRSGDGTSSSSKPTIEDTQTDLGRSPKSSNFVTGTSSSEVNRKVSLPEESSDHLPTSLEAKTDETENYKVKDEVPHVDKGKKEDTSEIDRLLNVNELNLELTLE